MGKPYLTSDLHLGHKNICKYRTDFNSPEEHDEIVFDNLVTTVNKRGKRLVCRQEGIILVKYYNEEMKWENLVRGL